MKAFNILFNIVIALFMGSAVALCTPLPALPTAGVILIAGQVVPVFMNTKINGVALMAIQKEIWTDYLRENLYKDNGFLNRAMNWDQYVLQGKIVHLQAAGGRSTVLKNRASLPAPIRKRTDLGLLFELDEYTTDPILIENAENYELSYNKMDSIMLNHRSGLSEALAEDILYHWCVSALGDEVSTATQTRTTGGAVAGHLGTGNRKLFLKEDLQKARTLLNKHKIAKEGRVAIIDSEMMDQLMQDADLKKRDTALELNLRDGAIGRLYGFDIFERSTVMRADNTGTPLFKLPEAADANDDNAVAICYHPSAVGKAVGTIEMFEDLKKPEYYGDIYSALLRGSGRLIRPEGVVAIIQAAA